MTYTPNTLAALARYWTNHGGVSLGVVGNKAHTVGYHLGKDRIYDGAGPGIGDRDYSVKLPRDKAGLTNGASAIDLGRLDGSLRKLRRFSEWLVQECQDHPAAYRDVREVIYSTVDGVYVKRWSRIDRKVYTSLRKNADGSVTVVTPGNGDASHYTHTHISFHRDSEFRDKRPLFAPYFEAPAQPDTEVDMPALASYLPGQVVTVKATSNVRVAPSLTAKVVRTAAADEDWEITGTVVGDKDTDGGCTTTTWYVRWDDGWEYTSGCNVVSGPSAPADDTPYSEADLDEATGAARADGIVEGRRQVKTSVAALPDTP